jgi:hypothetical protein
LKLLLLLLLVFFSATSCSLHPNLFQRFFVTRNPNFLQTLVRNLLHNKIPGVALRPAAARHEDDEEQSRQSGTRAANEEDGRRRRRREREAAKRNGGGGGGTRGGKLADSVNRYEPLL